MKRWLPALLLLTSGIAAATDPDLFGQWRGQVQYQATLTNAVDPAAHAVVGLTLSIEPQLRLIGISVENGCHLLGLATPTATPTRLDLDATLSGCRYVGFNRRLHGRAELDKAGRMVIVSFGDQFYNPATILEIKGTLAR